MRVVSRPLVVNVNPQPNSLSLSLSLSLCVSCAPYFACALTQRAPIRSVYHIVRICVVSANRSACLPDRASLKRAFPYIPYEIPSSIPISIDLCDHRECNRKMPSSTVRSTAAGQPLRLLLLLLLAAGAAVHAFTLPDADNPPPDLPEDESFLRPAHYHSTEQLDQLFGALAKQHPDLVRVHSVGRSRQGRDLQVLQISRSVRQRGLLVPMFKYVANMHGDETVGREMLVYLAQYLLANYGRRAEVRRLIDTTDIYLMPSMNPDGFEESEVSDVRGAFCMCWHRSGVFMRCWAV